MHTYHTQKGLTFIGLIIMLVIGMSILLAGVKIVPAYLEFASVKKEIQSLSEKPGFGSMTKNEVIISFNKSASTNYVTVIEGNELIIGKGVDGRTSVLAEYQVVTPLALNLSALI